MIWGTVLKRKNNILQNISERKYCEEMINALQEDVSIDTYQDTQPGGGSCLYNNYEQQEKYNEKLNYLYNLNLLFPNIYIRDIPTLEYFMQKLEDLNRGPGCFENSELADCVEQAFLFYKHFASHQISKKSVDEFCKIGEYIVNNTVKWDEEKECFYQIVPISFNMFYEIK